VTRRLKHARLLVPLLLATLAGAEFVPSLDSCPLQPRAAAVRPDIDLMRPQGSLRLAGLHMRTGPPSETGYDCPLYERQPVDPPPL
jgi:hypothetical protein